MKAKFGISRLIVSLVLMAAMIATITGCGGEGEEFDPLTEITVISREDGSGTRGLSLS